MVSAKDFGSATVSEVTSVYDGDTFRANIVGFPVIVGERMPVRVSGVDTPEIRGKCQVEKDLARKAKQFTVGKLRNAKSIELRNIARGKYFRLVADVILDGKNLALLLIEANLGVPYGGKTKPDWCKNP